MNEQQQYELFREKLRLGSEHNRSTVPLVQSAFQALILLNGGALAALLTLLGSMAKDSGPSQRIHALIHSDLVFAAVILFVVGAFVAVFVGAFGYLVQVQYRHIVWASFADDRHRERRNTVQAWINRFRVIGFGCGAGSLLCFLFGAVCVFAALRSVL